MQQEKLLINKREILIMFLFMILSLSPRFFYIQLNSMDELWNYQFARRILDGQVPYRDFFILMTPFAIQVNAFFLSLFSDKLIVMRIVGIFLASVNGVIIYIITREIGKSQLTALVTVYFFASLVFLYPQNNYSWYAVLFLSLALLFELKKLNNSGVLLSNYVLEFLIGASLGLATISKQNIGIFGLLASVGFLFCYTFFGNRQQKIVVSLFVKNLLFKVLGWMVVVGVELIYLWRNNALLSFIDQAFISTASFANEISIPYSVLVLDSYFLIKVFAIIVPLGIAGLLLKGVIMKNSTSQRSYILILSFYAVANFLMVYPLADTTHLIMGMPLAVVAFTHLFERQPRTKMAEKKVFVSPVFVFLMAVSLFTAGIILKPPNTTFHHDINRYQYVLLSENLIDEFEEVGTFIVNTEQEGQEVFFLNFRAPFYLIPMGEFGYKSDTMFKGNFGTWGEQEILDRLALSDNPIAIIRGSNITINRQETMVFENYVRQNMTYLKSVGKYDVFTW